MGHLPKSTFLINKAKGMAISFFQLHKTVIRDNLWKEIYNQEMKRAVILIPLKRHYNTV